MRCGVLATCPYADLMCPCRQPHGRWLAYVIMPRRVRQARRFEQLAVLRAQTHPLSATEADIARCGARYSGYMASEQTALGQAVLRPGGGLGSSWGYRGKAMAVEKGEERTAASEKAADHRGTVSRTPRGEGSRR